MEKKMNFLERVSYAAREGKEKAKAEFERQDSLEETKKKRKKALSFFSQEDEKKEG